MDMLLVVMILLIVAGIALGMYMDWFGLWVSDDELKRKIARASKDRLRDLGKQIGVEAPETAARTHEGTGTVSGTRI